MKKKYSAIFFQALFLRIVVVLAGIGALSFLLWEPHVEGRNAHATFFEIYFKDPFLAYAYVASVPFFAALYQAFKALGYAGQNRIFSHEAVNAFRTIKCCALATAGFATVAEILIMLGDSDDRAGGVFMVLLVIFGSIVTAAAAAICERVLQDAIYRLPKNDL